MVNLDLPVEWDIRNYVKDVLGDVAIPCKKRAQGIGTGNND